MNKIKKPIWIVPALLCLACLWLPTACGKRATEVPEPVPHQPTYGSSYTMYKFYKPNGTKVDDTYEVYNGRNKKLLYTEKWHYKEEDTVMFDYVYSTIEKTRDFESAPYEKMYYTFYLDGMLYFEKLGRYNMEILNTKILEDAKDSSFKYKQVPGRQWKWYGYYTPFTTIKANGKFYDTVIHAEIDSMPYPYDPKFPPDYFFQKNTHLYFSYNAGLVRIDDVRLEKVFVAGYLITDTVSFTQWIKKD